MKVGSIVYATDQGLGILAKSFYDAGVVNQVLIMRHAHHETHNEWYPNAHMTDIRQMSFDLMQRFCASCDVMLFFETPFDWRLLSYCKSIGIPTAIMPMYECMPLGVDFPDLYINPSNLDARYFPNRSVRLDVPVNVPWKLRSKARVFVHNSGHGGLKGRNGTEQLIEAMGYVPKSLDMKLIIRSQSNPIRIPFKDDRIDLRLGNYSYEKLWLEGDVFIFPEKFNGLSLPLQEAYAAGMLVMATNRFPMNTWLPTDPLIDVSGYRTNRIGPRYVEFQEAIVEPKTIADKIVQWTGKDIEEYSTQGLHWAKSMSWEVLKPMYLNVLDSLTH